MPAFTCLEKAKGVPAEDAEKCAAANGIDYAKVEERSGVGGGWRGTASRFGWRGVGWGGVGEGADSAKRGGWRGRGGGGGW